MRRIQYTNGLTTATKSAARLDLLVELSELWALHRCQYRREELRVKLEQRLIQCVRQIVKRNQSSGVDLRQVGQRRLVADRRQHH